MLIFIVIVCVAVFINGMNKVIVKDAYVRGNVSSFDLYKLEEDSITKTDEIIYRGSSIKLYTDSSSYGKSINIYLKTKYGTGTNSTSIYFISQLPILFVSLIQFIF